SKASERSGSPTTNSTTRHGAKLPCRQSVAWRASPSWSVQAPTSWASVVPHGSNSRSTSASPRLAVRTSAPPATPGPGSRGQKERNEHRRGVVAHELNARVHAERPGAQPAEQADRQRREQAEQASLVPGHDDDEP